MQTRKNTYSNVSLKLFFCINNQYLFSKAHLSIFIWTKEIRHQINDMARKCRRSQSLVHIYIYNFYNHHECLRLQFVFSCFILTKALFESLLGNHVRYFNLWQDLCLKILIKNRVYFPGNMHSMAMKI